MLGACKIAIPGSHRQSSQPSPDAFTTECAKSRKCARCLAHFALRTFVCMKTKPTTTLSPLELRRKIAVREAAQLNGVSEATFRRHYGHLIRKISARRDVVELRDAIDLPPK